ncbi:macrolide ABC transporter permease [Plantibacter flavus]|uniref:ABC transporter permease n=1 Tax=Plantibacter TaxID=190323 RepID=UPI0010C23FA8|nr:MULTISPECIES: ABC transporter permease [Plantibacter]MBD8103821.1 ABC transporter permease [Plantibacter sp. CFBP 8775]MBD8467269.1 ABC transporter permease [Plantibacter sp. CFBP 8798]TKJ96745.1 macrolide ABC transporter permease [Plantibacter flavus]
MTLAELAASSIRGIRGNITRSGLTVLMVLIGVSSVITLVAVGNGTTKQVNDQIASLGASAIDLFPGYSQDVGQSQLTLDDATALSESPLGTDIDLVAPTAGGYTKIIAGAEAASASIIGTTPEYFTIKNSQLVTGRTFTLSDALGGEAVGVVDQTLASKLFPEGRSAIGQTILAGGSPIRVVGILAPTAADKKFGTQGGDGTLIAPIDRMRATISGYGPLASITLSARSPTAVNAAKTQAVSILAARGTPSPNIFSSDQLRETLGGAQESLNGMLSSVAAISLLVGGIGVTNVMLLTVRERTREIGIRKALGAPAPSIAGQFVIEATALSVIGGSLGVLTALIVTRFPINGVMPVIDGTTVLLAAGLSVTIGIFFGTYPAVQAARLNPVDALRVGT